MDKILILQFKPCLHVRPWASKLSAEVTGVKTFSRDVKRYFCKKVSASGSQRKSDKSRKVMPIKAAKLQSYERKAFI